jgi:hypothetical protein
MDLITNEEIKETEIFKNSEKMYQNLLLQYANKKKISEGIVIFKNCGVYPGFLGGKNLKIVKELTQPR